MLPGECLRTTMTDAALRGDVYMPDCPSRAILDHVTSRWGTLALIALIGGPLRFSELGRLLGGVSDKMLSKTLKTLGDDGLLERQAFLEVPVRVEYQLSASGREIAERLAVLTDWIEHNVARVLDARRQPAVIASP